MCDSRLKNARILLVALGLALCLPLRAASITVFAAASLADSLQEIAADYQKQTGDTVTFNLAGSSTLARQIEASAPADVFFSADEAKMDSLEKKGLLAPGTRQTRLSNALVLVVATDNTDIHSPADLARTNVSRIALGDPRAVPIGIYAKEYLMKQGLWAKIEPKVVPTENVRAALAAVEAGNADASIVYKTDALISKKVKVVFEVAPADGPKIHYPMALIKDSKNAEAARRFLNYLGSNEAGRVFQKYGFVVLEMPPAK